MLPSLCIPSTLIPAWHPFHTGETMVFRKTWEWYPMLWAPITASSLTEYRFRVDAMKRATA
jgi:hypothetical protein